MRILKTRGRTLIHMRENTAHEQFERAAEPERSVVSR